MRRTEQQLGDLHDRPSDDNSEPEALGERVLQALNVGYIQVLDNGRVAFLKPGQPLFWC